MRNKIFFNRNILAISFAVLAVLITGCGSGQTLISSWPAQAIQIDGSSEDWQGNLQAFPKDNYSVGFRNDTKFLYVCFITVDRNKIMTIMRSGLNVSFDSPTEPYKNYTIIFPVFSPGSLSETRGINGPESDRQEDNTNPFNEILKKQFQFNLLEKDFVNNLPLNNKENIELKMGMANEILVYELKVPLSKTKSSFTIGSAPGETIGIKFRTEPPKYQNRAAARVDREMAGEQNGEDGPPAGGRGGRGGRRGANMGSRGGNTSKFEADFTIQLTKETVKN